MSNRKIAIKNLAILQTGDLPAILCYRTIFGPHRIGEHTARLQNFPLPPLAAPLSGSLKNKSLFLGSGLFFRVLPPESLYPAGRVHEFYLAGKKRMALRADIHGQVLFGGAGSGLRAAGAVYPGLFVVRVNSFFHKAISLRSSLSMLS